jgi:RNA polymerase sigma-B factor
VGDGGGRPDRDEVDRLLNEYVAHPRRAVRNRIVEVHMGLAASRTRRLRRSAAPDDDLEQVAFLALVKAVDRFDPTKGASFATFATRTIDGELKRHLRDATWDVRVPRSLKELHVSARSVSAELAQRLGRSPSVGDIAEELGVGREEVLAAMGAGTSRDSESLDAGSGSGGEGGSGGTTLAQDHIAAIATAGGFEAVDNAEMLSRLLEHVGERDREILRLRFAERLSQEEIAGRIGVSQMQVSRLLRRTLDQLRREAARGAGAEPGEHP